MPADAIVIETSSNPDAAIIWLHGLGADGNDFAPIVPEQSLDGLSLRFVFPHAPKIPVSINNGFVMRAWYDIISPNLLVEPDEKGMRNSQQVVQKYIDAQIEQGIDSNRIILAGFSQGGAIALLTGLRCDKSLAGIIALSTYLPLADTLSTEATAANKAIPIFMGHGTQDPIVPRAAGAKSKQTLESLGYPVDWHEYVMEHSVNPKEIDDIGSWIKARLGK